NQSFCNNYSNLEYTACVSGTFHEYSKSGTGLGHENYYQRSHEYKEIDCNIFNGEEYTLCYGSVGSVRQYFPESESIKLTYQVCGRAKTEKARKLCKYTARQRLDIARGYSFVDFK